MEYPLILRNEDGTKSITVKNAAEEATAAPVYKRRSEWSKPKAESAPVAPVKIPVAAKEHK